VSVSGYVPTPVTAGVPLNVAVPFGSALRESPAGRAPISLMAGAGNPDAVIVNIPALPAMNDAPAALVIRGGLGSGLTVSAKVWKAAEPMPLSAVKVSG